MKYRKTFYLVKNMHSNGILISVVLGVKNANRTIDKFIQAINNQTYQNIELIIVDNDSDDGTKAKLDLALNQGLITKLYTQGPERSAQRNKGINEASGKYVLVLDADQYLSAKVVEEAVKMCEEQGYDSLFITEETVAGGYWGKCKKFERDFYMIGDISVEALRFFNKDKVKSLEIPGFDENTTGVEDFDLTDRFIAKYPKYSRTKSRLIHDEGEINLKEQIKKKKYYSKTGLVEYLKRAPKFRKTTFPLRPSCFKQWYRFLLHPILTIGVFYMKFAESIPVLLKMGANKS